MQPYSYSIRQDLDYYDKPKTWEPLRPSLGLSEAQCRWSRHSNTNTPTAPSHCSNLLPLTSQTFTELIWRTITGLVKCNNELQHKLSYTCLLLLWSAFWIHLCSFVQNAAPGWIEHAPRVHNSFALCWDVVVITNYGKVFRERSTGEVRLWCDRGWREGIRVCHAKWGACSLQGMLYLHLELWLVSAIPWHLLRDSIMEQKDRTNWWWRFTHQHIPL